jgi:hypothetical protein
MIKFYCANCKKEYETKTKDPLKEISDHGKIHQSM